MSKYITMKDYEHIKENARTEAERIDKLMKVA